MSKLRPSGRVYLYVEDDPLSRQVMELMAGSVLGDVRLIVFENTENFMDRLAALDTIPDLILLDVHIRPVDGFEVLATLRLDERYAHVPVIALTASVMAEEIAHLHIGGFDGAIGKPISVSTFPGLIQRILAGEAVWHVV